MTNDASIAASRLRPGVPALPAATLPQLAAAAERLVSRVAGTPVAREIVELLVFGLKELAACIFAGSFLLLLALSNGFHVPGLARYEVLFLGAIGIQLVLIVGRLETWREVAVLSLFHALGMGVEIFKTSPAIHA